MDCLQCWIRAVLSRAHFWKYICCNSLSVLWTSALMNENTEQQIIVANLFCIIYWNTALTWSIKSGFRGTVCWWLNLNWDPWQPYRAMGSKFDGSIQKICFIIRSYLFPSDVFVLWQVLFMLLKWSGNPKDKIIPSSEPDVQQLVGTQAKPSPSDHPQQLCVWVLRECRWWFQSSVLNWKNRYLLR